MMNIATLTMNPAIDVSFEVEQVLPTHKMRCRNERHDPGGGGINVARVFVRLGGNARCHYLSGGATGVALDGLMDLHQLVRTRTPIAGETRVSTTVFERSSAREFRFVTRGPNIAPEEWQAVLDRLDEADFDYLVASGSLPPGVPDDFYARAAAVACKRGARFVLDSSGVALAGGLTDRGVYLVKPSLDEMTALAGRELIGDGAVAEAAGSIVGSGKAKHVAVTLGAGGAMLVNAHGVVRLPAIPVEVASSVGAGDSFLAAMLHRLASGRDEIEAFRFGVAAGAAALLSPGTGLAKAADVARLYEQQFH
jgi:6-phosphofructokinase 2